MSDCGTPSNFQTHHYFHGPLTNFPPPQIAHCQQWYNSYHGYMKVNWLLFCMRQLSCGGWWLSGCRGSVAEHWQLKPKVPWVRLPATAGLFTFLFFRLITSKFIYFQREARCSEQLSLSLGCPNTADEAYYELNYILRST